MKVLDWLNGKKTAIGGMLTTIALGLGLLNQDEVDAIMGLVQTATLFVGQALTVWGALHKALKRSWD